MDARKRNATRTEEGRQARQSRLRAAMHKRNQELAEAGFDYSFELPTKRSKSVDGSETTASPAKAKATTPSKGATSTTASNAATPKSTRKNQAKAPASESKAKPAKAQASKTGPARPSTAPAGGRGR